MDWTQCFTIIHTLPYWALVESTDWIQTIWLHKGTVGPWQSVSTLSAFLVFHCVEMSNIKYTLNTDEFSCFTVIEEGGVKMKLTLVDTPGFGDQINNDNWWVLNPLDQ